jgi:hypothetical protein
MSTSGTIGFAPTLVEIFEEAFERATGDELRYGYQVRSMRRSLNLLLLDWQNRGYNLWMLAEATTYAQTSDITVPLATNCVDTIEVMIDTVPSQTTLSLAINAAVTSISIATAFGTTPPYVLQCGDEQLNVTAGTSTTLTVTRGYNGTTAATHALNDPIFKPTPANAEQPLMRYSVPDYASLPNKTTMGRPSAMLVRRETPPVTLTLWPVPDQVYAVHYYYLRRVEDAGNGQNEPDVPIRFVPALIAGLAYYAVQKLPGQAASLPLFQSMYEEALASARSEDREKAALRLVPRVGRVRR